jgi:site-specific recombinase XerD
MDTRLLEWAAPASNSVAVAVRCIRRLGEYQQFGALVRLRQTKKEKNWTIGDEALIEAYVNAMQTVDNSEATKRTRTHHLKLFYGFLEFRRVESITEITAQILSDYALSLEGGSLVYAKHRLSTLRHYLQFLHTKGYCEKDLSYAVPRVKAPKNLNVPALWSKEEIEKLLKCVDRGHPAGKRDYAILLLVIQLGIRISDIAGLQLDSLKWDRKEIEFCQHKTGKRVIYPMLGEIGWAIIDYIRYARPKITNPHLFVTCNAPYTSLGRGSVGSILDRQMLRCGIHKSAGTVSSMHSLRHAIARSLLEQNIPLPLLIEIMGHARMSSSTPYVKVDIEGLRECGLSLEEWWRND